jgi:ABC-type transport system involved in cytochrome bd biosynthesis fused ATPase/permease subunit
MRSSSRPVSHRPSARSERHGETSVAPRRSARERPAPRWVLGRIVRLGRGMRGRFVLAALAGTAAAGCAVGLGATAAWLVSRAAQHPPVLYLMVAIVAVRAFGLGRGVLRYAERLAGHDAALRVLGGLRVTVYRRLAELAPAGLTRLRSGDLAARVVDDVDGLADLWLRLILPYAVAGLVGAGTVALLAALLPGAGLVLAASLLVVALAAPALATRLGRHAEARIAPLRGDLHATVVDLLRGAEELTAHGTAAEALAAADRADSRLRRAERRAAAGQGLGAALATLAGGAAVWAGLALGAPAVHAGTLPAVALAVVVLAPLAIHEIAAALPAAATELPRLRGAATRVTTLLDTPNPVTDPATPAPDPQPPYDIRITNLTVAWPAAVDPVTTPALAGGQRAHRPVAGQDGPAGEAPVLRGVDLDIPAGARVAVIGPSGVGKSTLAAALLKFVAPVEGRITLGGTNLAELTGEQVRRVVGICAQDAHVFDSTVAENVRLARPDATDEELRGALRRARLLEWVEELPDGLDTFVGEHGRQLSGGQRQRLALARALLADVPVLILDEPTEHLDEATGTALTRDLLAAAAGRTVLLLTHRRAEEDRVDRVVELRDGVAVPDPAPRPRTFVA